MIVRLYLFFMTLVTLFGIGLLEKWLFARHHAALTEGMESDALWSTLLWGFRFDLAIATGLTLAAFIIAYLVTRPLNKPLQVMMGWTGFAAAVLLVGIHGADLLYYGEAGRHLGYELKEGLNSGGSLFVSAVKTYYGQVGLQLLIMVAVFFWFKLLYRFTVPSGIKKKSEETTRVRQKLAPELSLILVLLVSVVLLRGGFQSVPLEPLHAQEIGDSRRAALALNGAYNALFSSIATYDIRPVLEGEPSTEQLARLRQMYQSPANDTLPTTGEAPDADVQTPAMETPPFSLLEQAQRTAERPNVVFILLESWSGTYMAPYGFNKPTTPNFDRLRNGSLTTLAMVAGGKRTTEGMFATFCSAQNPLGQTIAQSQLQNYDYECLPELLRDAGWYTAFFQGTNKNTSGTGAFALSLGFEHSYGRLDIDPAKATLPLNSWGYHDPDIYAFAIEQMRSMPQPFLVGINTNTTHTVEPLPEGVKPRFDGTTELDGYLNLLHFSDDALGKFIEQVNNDPALANTIFVLVADHAGKAPPDPLLNYLIPFAIYAPGQVTPAKVQRVASQRDIAPTVLEQLGLPVPAHYTGISLLGDHPGFADYYHQGTLGWVEDNLVVEFPVTQPTQMQCLHLTAQAQLSWPHTCGDIEQQLQQRALAFTQAAQSLLFKGKLAEFAGLR